MIHSNPHPTASHRPWLAGTAALAILALAVAAQPGTPAIATSLLHHAIPAASAEDSLIISPAGGVGIGTANPVRQLHMVGDNAVFRMDRSTDAATFMLVRTDTAGDVLKTFSVGTRASGSNNGEFVVQDFGTATGGASERRLTITNDGEAHFTGTVRAPNFVSTSSARFKDNIETIRDASLAVQQLRGVRFSWKDSGQPALGLVAEEVLQVYPELVDNDDGKPAAVNYPALVAVLVQAVKEQQSLIDAQENQIAAQQSRLDAVENRQAELEQIKARMATLEERIRSEGLLSATWSGSRVEP